MKSFPRPGWWVCASAVLLMLGCQVPDIKPLADATLELRQATATAGVEAVRTAETGVVLDSNNQPLATTSPEHPARQLEDAWKTRLSAMDALVEYSDSLANIADAANNAAANTQALGDTVTRLASFVPGGVSAPLSAGVQLGAVIAKSAIEVKAAKNLADAVEKAHPALQAIASIIKKDLADLAVLHTNESRRLEMALVNQFGPRRTYWEKVRTQRSQAADALAANFNAQNLQQVRDLDALAAATDPERADYESARGTLLEHRHAFRQLIAKSSEAVDKWIESHGNLKSAIAQNRRPNVRLLLTRVQEVRDILEQIKTDKNRK